jgi:cytochrome c biogenesis protein CcdA
MRFSQFDAVLCSEWLFENLRNTPSLTNIILPWLKMVILPILSKKISIWKALSRVIIIIASLSILLSIIVNTALDITHQKQKLKIDFNTIAGIIAGIIAHNIIVSSVLTDKTKLYPKLSCARN